MTAPARPRLRVVPDAAALARAAADEVAAAAEAAVAARGAFSLALAGGSTPRALYALLADPAAAWRARIDWPGVRIWFGDERCVPPDHPDSNFRMAREALLDAVGPGQVHRIEGERPPEEAARRYEKALRAAAGGGVPSLDLVLLGLGADGHTASLFPGTAAVEEQARLVAAPFVPRLGQHRVTLTRPVLDAARAVLFVVAGEDKAAAVARLVAPPPGAPPVPAGLVHPASGPPRVLADAAAASLAADAERW